MFQIDKDHPPSVGPISRRYKWCCNNGCGECTPVLVEFRTYHSTLNGATDQERTEPRLVSTCCGEGMFLWDTTLDDDGPVGYDGSLAGPPQKNHQPTLSTAPTHLPMPEHWHVVVGVNGDNILCIGESYLHGKRELSEAEENAVVGAAQHLLSFAGYGLPPSSFDPDADDDGQQPCATPDGEPSNVELRGMWYGAGGMFHGPNVETGTMPEAKLLPFMRSLIAAPQPAPTGAAENTPAQCPYSIDADPQGIRAMVADAITGALGFGAQGTNPPPSGHWLAPFWNAARADRSQADSALKDAALLDWQSSERVEVSPEYEGPWHAAVFGEDEKPVFLASGNTPREALIAARKQGGA